MSEHKRLGDSIENDDLSIIQKAFIEIKRQDTWWKKFKREFRWKIEILIYKIFGRYFEAYWDYVWLIYYGHNPIAVINNYYGEVTFIFQTDEEAKNAFDELEAGHMGSKKPSVIGWFYGIDSFIGYLEDEQEEYDWKGMLTFTWINPEYYDKLEPYIGEYV